MPIAWNKGKHPEYMQGKNHPMYGIHLVPWNKGKRDQSILFKCKTCRTEFYRTKSLVYWRGAGKFCSKKCKGKWMSKNLKGKKSLGWIDGRSKKNRRIRYSTKMANWRKRVFVRDNYTCQKCNARNGNGKDVYLEAHHIKSFVLYPKLRFTIKNGITLCEDCHDNITFNHQNSVTLLKCP
jgi:hypothetical protein